MVPQKRLTVVPNPFAVPLDQHGRPCAVVLYDPANSGGFARYIGATMERNVIEKRSLTYSPSQKQNVGGGGQLDKVDLSWSFDLSPVEIEDTRYHRKAISDGLLLPANESTAKASGVKFVQASKLLANAQAQAIAEWERDNETKVSVESWKVANAPKVGDK